MPSLLRPPFFGPKFEMTLPFTGQRKRSLPRGAGSGSGSGGMAAISVCFGVIVFGGSCETAGVLASGVVVSSIGVLSGVEGAVASGVVGTVAVGVAACCFGG